MRELPKIDREMTARIAEAKRMLEQAAELQVEAAAAWRGIAHELREAGFSVSEIATTLGISRGRVSQLLLGG